jgi:hypothetical protein
MRRVLLVLAGAIGVIGALVLLFIAYSNTEFTQCFGSFESVASAERAAEQMEDQGFDADLGVAGRPQESVIFESGETGGDAAEFREAFWDTLEREGGKSGHGRTGCLERGPFI